MKKRLDQLIFDKGLVESRSKAQAIIMSGNVFVDGVRVDKVGTQVPEDAEIMVEKPFPYVSRGALKLEKAYDFFGLDFKDKIICDIGSSTGGFTDFALQHGAKKVFAIDVGTGQLAQKLREDDRVVVMEKTDFRDISFCNDTFFSCHSCERGNLPDNGDPRVRKDDSCCCLTDLIDIFVCDVSFVSLKKIIPKIAELVESQMSSSSEKTSKDKNVESCQDFKLCHPEHTKDPGLDSSIRSQNDTGIEEPIQNSKLETQNSSVECILLIKPQFEVGKKEASRGKGVITDPDLHNAVIQEIQDCALENNFKIVGIIPSPITGAKGNKEFLLYLKT